MSISKELGFIRKDNPSDYFDESMKTYSVFVLIHPFGPKVYESISRQRRKVTVLRNMQNEGIELSVLARNKSEVLDVVEDFLYASLPKKFQFKIESIVKVI